MAEDRLPPPDLPDWDEPAGRPRRRVLLVAATVPWVVVAVLLVRGLPGGTPAPERAPTPGPAATSPRAPDGPDGPGEPAGAPRPGSSPPPTRDVRGGAGRAVEPGRTGVGASGPDVDRVVVEGGGRTVVGPGEAAAVGAVVARNWLSSVGPVVEGAPGPAGAATYVEHVTVETVDFPAPGAAVVSTVVVLLHVEDGEYARAEAVRLAVPVRLDRDGARPGGAPWRLPPPDLAVDPPVWREVDEPGVLTDAAAAVDAAGYRDAEIRDLARAEGWPWRVRLAARAPGAADREEHTLWLRPHLGGFVVAGWRPVPAPDGPSEPTAGGAVDANEQGGRR